MRIITTITLALALACLAGCSKQQPPQPVQPVQPADSSTTEPKDPPQVATPDPQDQAEPKTGTDTTSTKPPQAAVTPPKQATPPKPQAKPITPEDFKALTRLIQRKKNEEALKMIAERPELAKYTDGRRSTLAIAARAENIEIVDALLYKYDVKKDLSLILMTATMRGNLEISDKMLKHGADPNFRVNGNGVSSLHQSVEYGRSTLENVKFLVEAGADVNIVNEQMRNTPLDIAMMTKKANMQAYLRSKGAKTYKELNP